MNARTNSTENLLDLSPTANAVFSYENKGLSFQLLAKKVSGKRLSLRDCYLMVNEALRQVSNNILDL